MEGSGTRAVRLLPLSGKSAGALRALAGSYLAWLDGAGGPDSGEALSDLAWTAGVGRSHFSYRAGLVFSDAAELAQELQALSITDEYTDREVPRAATRVAFAYPGRDSLRAGSGEALYRTEPVARAVLDRCDELIRRDRDLSLLGVMFGPASADQHPDDPAWAYPALYALGCALTAQWASVGIHPRAVWGRGPGALAAAQAAAVFSLEEGLRLASALGAVQASRRVMMIRALWKVWRRPWRQLEVAAPSVSSGQHLQPAGWWRPPPNLMSITGWVYPRVRRPLELRTGPWPSSGWMR